MTKLHRIYRITREVGQVKVWVHQASRPARELDPRYDLVRHSPDGFEFGYHGSGPAQLALALLADHFNKWPDGDDLAKRIYQRFKAEVIANINQNLRETQLNSEQIEKWWTSFDHYNEYLRTHQEAQS